MAVLLGDVYGFPHAFRSDTINRTHNTFRNFKVTSLSLLPGHHQNYAMFRTYENPYSRPSTCERDPNWSFVAPLLINIISVLIAWSKIQ